ncbi:NAD(P)/FAD-dependent oxidoreductase [Dactylosporangium roseum]|uniref:NAD(P)/FAD-dependent oxidoreductase n=1 Tax=Dactylosporangium roseum TaxID=47989 RepID=A0ABY5Z0N9_9ACTN|nr:NAD(P)/FAD-dependent oxidoreductase [Dactylosporangium roseum]UWZ34437.1 NAD(P)/FAD-dependent oxidoreductase [Dactylosporangium roseum]
MDLMSRRARRRPSIAIVGAGLGGIAAAVKLKRAGFDDFVVFEAEAGPGGTWWRNTYPGAEVDVHSALYSFSFASHNWTRTHAGQAEILRYIQDILDAEGIREHFRFGTRVLDARWSDDEHRYRLRDSTGATHEVDVLVSAVGFLSDPKLPDWSGLNSFGGPAFHTQYWDHGVDLAGKRVAIVGSGSTATQIVPAIADRVEQVTMFQREPGWILPKGDRDFTAEEMRRYASPVRRRLRRLKLFVQAQLAYQGGAVHHSGSKRNARAEVMARAYIDKVFGDRPDLKAAVTPQYEFSGKRRILQSTFYPALLRDNVRLVTRAVADIGPGVVIDESGTKHKADVLVIATGFRASEYLSTLDVFGRDGRRLRDVWRDGPFAFLGMTVPGFPNFYMLYGPNTNGGPILFHHELQANYIVRELRTMLRSGATAIEVRPWIVDAYNRWLQRRLANTAWAHANNYMKDSRGRIVTQWGDGLIRFWLLHRTLRRVSSTRRRRDGGR